MWASRRVRKLLGNALLGDPTVSWALLPETQPERSPCGSNRENKRVTL